MRQHRCTPPPLRPRGIPPPTPPAMIHGGFWAPPCGSWSVFHWFRVSDEAVEFRIFTLTPMVHWFTEGLEFRVQGFGVMVGLRFPLSPLWFVLGLRSPPRFIGGFRF